MEDSAGESEERLYLLVEGIRYEGLCTLNFVDMWLESLSSLLYVCWPVFVQVDEIFEVERNTCF